MDHTAWYELVSNGGAATVTTAGSLFDTALFVYESRLPPAPIACNDDSDGQRTSSVTFPTRPGLRYYVQAGSACVDWMSCQTSMGGPLRILATTGPNPDVDGDGIPGTQAGGADCGRDADEGDAVPASGGDEAAEDLLVERLPGRG